MAAADPLPALLLVLLVFGGSTYLAAIPIRREVARAVRRGEPLPRIVGWWQRVVAHASWLLGIGGALILLGAFVWFRGMETSGGWLMLIGLALGAYLMQGLYLMRAVRRAADRARQDAAAAPPRAP